MNFHPSRKRRAAWLLLPLLLSACATESARTVTPSQVTAVERAYDGPRSTIAVGKFDNRSSFLRGLFSDGIDRLGSQAKTILISHLQQSQRFIVVDRNNLTEIRQEAELRGKDQKLKGAGYLLTGDVTAFGRKETGDEQLFGILGRGKTQVAYAKVSINVVDALTSEVVFSVQGAGEVALSNREIIGFGDTASYDSTLNGKVLDLAIREAVDRLVEGVERGAWTPSH